jgi:hypothetical protein
MSTAELSPDLLEKLQIMQEKLGTADLQSALDKSLNIAHFVSDTLSDPRSKLLVERDGKFQQLTEFF